jgi:Ca-activated chloride channel family protein
MEAKMTNYRKRIKTLFSGLVFVVLTFSVYGQNRVDMVGGFFSTRILFVFDASQSMAGYWESDQKINIARNFLINVIDSLQYLNNIQMALRVYGHQSPVPPQDCKDSKLEVPFDINNTLQIKQKLKYLKPKGTTPIAYSLERAAEDFPPCDDCRNIIILITDGIEACEGDPCEVSRKLQQMGITLRPFIIGIGMDPQFKKTFDCVGYYYNAANEERFKEVLEIVITQVLNTTSAQVNLLDQDGNPTETNVNMTFYDLISGKIRYNFMHTINMKGDPDLLFLDPLVSYKLVIHTLPPITIDTVIVTAGKHTIIGADAPQGYIELKSQGKVEYNDLQAIIREDGKMNTLNYQKMNTTDKYIIGKYDIEIPTLPKILLEDIEVLQSHTTIIEIPRPGIVTFLSLISGYGSLYLDNNDKMEWITNLDIEDRRQSIVILPGNYIAVFRSRNAYSTLTTIVKKFSISSGSSIAIELN